LDIPKVQSLGYGIRNYGARRKVADGKIVELEKHGTEGIFIKPTTHVSAGKKRGVSVVIAYPSITDDWK
jgi:hypothetical protein